MVSKITILEGGGVYPWSYGGYDGGRLLPRIGLSTFDASDGLAVSSADGCSSADFGHEFLDLVFDVAVAAGGGTCVAWLVAWGG